METPETIRTSLQAGEWVTSIDCKDAYFHIPIKTPSRKYMHFHLQGRFYQFKALPFGLSTAPMEFMVVAKEVKLMALQRGIRIHQYLDNWLVRVRSHHTCLQHIQTLVALCRELGWLVNREKSEPVQLEGGQGQTHIKTLAGFTNKNNRYHVLFSMPGPTTDVLDRPPYCYRKASPPRSTTHETHIVALKNKWRVPESLGKIIPISRSLHSHLKWWLEESNVLQGQPLHPLKHAL